MSVSLRTLRGEAHQGTSVTKPLRVLVEIRLRRSERIEEPTTDERLALWMRDTPFNRQKLVHAAHLANQLYGPETHWIEERQA